jgi:hypothetical protein
MQIRVDSENTYCCYIIIELNNKQYIADKEIAKLLNITYNEYICFLIKNNAYCDVNNNLMFHNKYDCKKCIEKLKEKYSDNLICTALMGD